MSDKCLRCTATTKQGTRCKRTTCKYSPFCASHKAYYAAQSTIPNSGRGIFAAKNLRRVRSRTVCTRAGGLVGVGLLTPGLGHARSVATNVSEMGLRKMTSRPRRVASSETAPC